MLQNLKYILAVWLCLLPYGAFAETYWIDDNGTAANLAACSGSTPLSGAAACSYDKANGSGVVAGDTVYYREGTYSGITGSAIAPYNSGTSGSRITFSAYNNEKVTFVAGDQSAYCIRLPSQDYVTIRGITCSNFNYHFHFGTAPSSVSGNNVADSDYNEIDSCTFTGIYNSLAGDVWRGSTIWGNYNWVHRCTFSNYGYFGANDDMGVPLELGWDDGLAETCKNNVIENNSLVGGGHHVIGIQGSRNVVRNNWIQNYKWADVGGTLYGSKVVYMVGKLDNDEQNLLENNRIGYGADSPEASTPEGEGILMSTDKNILRYNSFIRNYMSGIYLDGGHAGSPSPTQGVYNAIYNNTFWYCGYYEGNTATSSKTYWDTQYTHAIVIDEAGGSINNLIANNIFYQNNNKKTGLANYSVIKTYSPSGWDVVAQQDMRNNWDVSQGDPKFINITGTPDPTNSTQYNFNLQSDSGAIDGGSHLTEANGSGSNSTSLVVNNAYPFQDGWGHGAGGGAVVVADWICVGTVSNCVQISSINYSTKTITLSSAISWSNGAYIWLYKNSSGTRVLYGNAPDCGAWDIGAYEYISTAGNTGFSISGGSFR